MFKFVTYKLMRFWAYVQIVLYRQKLLKSMFMVV